jgi:hypothetical protein
LKLETHHSLVAPNATVEIIGLNGTELFPIASSNAFKGDVYENVFGKEMKVGWARLVISNVSKDSTLSIDGSFKSCNYLTC